jgi:RPA family protein
MSSLLDRHAATRVFLRELNDVTYKFKTGDDQKAPTYTLLPTGEKAHRVHVAGAITDYIPSEERTGNSGKLTIANEEGTISVYTNQYTSDDVMNQITSLSPPCHIAVTGKPELINTDDEEPPKTTLRVESLSKITQTDRDLWASQTALRTAERISAFQTFHNTHPPDAEPSSVEEIMHSRALDIYGADVSAYLEAVRAHLNLSQASHA